MNKTRSLESLLRDHSISADDFLETQGISSQIRSNLSKFVDYCRTHRPFALRILQLAFNISYQELQDPRIRTASHTANEIFGSEENEIAELFFEALASSQTQTTEIAEQISGIQSEAQRLFRFDDEDDQTLPPQQPREVEISGQELVRQSLQILKDPEMNETCLGHLQKMYSFFIRHEPIPVLEYFDKHPEMLQLLFKNIKYSSVSTLLAQLLTSEDKKKEYRFQGMKKMILERVVEEVFQKIEDTCFFDGALAFMDEILNVTKQSYYQYFEDFMRISHYLVSQPVLKRFYDQLFKLQEGSFLNTSKFLENLFIRINGEVQDNRYYHKEESQQSIDFQIHIFIKNLSALLALTAKFQNCSSIAKIHYLSFLDSLFNTSQVKASPLPLSDPSFLDLLEAYRLQKDGGMCKSKIYTLICNILSKASQDESKIFLDEHKQMYSHYFPTLKGANYGNTKLYNKNQGSAFDISLIAKLTRKEEGALTAASEAIGKDLKRMCKKYDTKIATFQNSKNSGEEQSIFGSFNINNFKNSESNASNQTVVGKNSISIPTLHLPQRFHSLENKDNDRSPEMPPNELSDSPKEIVEEEQVVNLTNKLGTMQGNEISLTAILREEGRKSEEETRWPEGLIIPKQELWEKEQSEEQTKVVEDRSEKETGTSTKGLFPQISVPQQGSDKQEATSCKGAVKGDLQKARFFSRHLPIFC